MKAEAQARAETRMATNMVIAAGGNSLWQLKRVEEVQDTCGSQEWIRVNCKRIPTSIINK